MARAAQPAPGGLSQGQLVFTKVHLSVNDLVEGLDNQFNVPRQDGKPMLQAQTVLFGRLA